MRSQILSDPRRSEHRRPPTRSTEVKSAIEEKGEARTWTCVTEGHWQSTVKGARSYRSLSCAGIGWHEVVRHVTYELLDMKILQDVHPRRDGLQEAEVCCKLNRSADTVTDVLLIPKVLAEQERAQARKGEDEEERSSSDIAKVYYALSPSGRRQVIDEYRKLVLAASRAPDFFPRLVSMWRPTGKRVHSPEIVVEEEA